MGAVIRDLFDEMVGVEALAVNPPVVIGEGHNHGVDVTRSHTGFQLVAADHAPQPVHRISLLDTPRTGSRE